MVRTSRPTITSTRSLIYDAKQIGNVDKGSCVVVNPSANANSIFIGGPNVTTGNGVTIVPGGNFAFDSIGPGDDIWAIASSNTTVELLTTGI